MGGGSGREGEIQGNFSTVVFLTNFLQFYFQTEQKLAATFAYCSHVVPHKMPSGHQKTGLSRISQVMSLMLASIVPTISKAAKVLKKIVGNCHCHWRVQMACRLCV